MSANYDNLIEPVARHFWDEPNKQLSKPDELRFGSNGSKSVSLTKNQYYDHEANEGGGVIQLVQMAAGIQRPPDAHQWLVDNGFLDGDSKKLTRNAKAAVAAKVMQVMSTSKTAPKTSKTKPKEVATYDYCAENGDILVQVVRMDPKTFRQRRPSGDGWVWSVKDVRVVPYRLPELLKQPDEPVFVVEGEKDADRLASLGLMATCNAAGAGKWTLVHAEFLRSRRVIILPDNDSAGAKHAQQVLTSLKGIAAEARILTLPDLPEKGDVSDWLDAGGTVAELIRMGSTPIAEVPEVAEADDDNEGRKPSQSDLLVKFAKERFDMLHDKNGETFALDRSTGEVRRLSSRQFRDRLAATFYQEIQSSIRDQAWREALSTLQALARYEGEPQEVHIRVAGLDGRYFVDLCQAGNSRAIELSASGWQILDKAPVLFVRGEAMQALPDPIHGGSIDPLWKIANIPSNLRMLVLTWLIDCMRPETPFPGLELIGEQGSGKSTAAEALRRLLDPNSCNLRGAPKTVEDIFVSSGQNHIVAYENVSHLPVPMQDALAILSTGGGYAKRQLYTDGDEHVINVRRPWMINGISICVTQQDLVDRVISIECPVIEMRQSSSQQWKDFELSLASILGGLFDLTAGALRELPSISLPREDRPRLVEYVLLGMAAAKASGQEPDSFLEQFKETRAETVARTLDASPVAAAVMDFIASTPHGIEASVKDILTRLEHYKPQGADAWPRSPKGLGDALRRASPALRQMGVECKSLGNIGGKVIWVIKKKPQQPSLASHEVMDSVQDIKTSMTSSPAQTSNDETVKVVL